MLLVFEKLSVFLCFGSAASLISSATLSARAFLGLSGFFILSIDLAHHVANLWIWIGLDKVAEKVGETQEVSKSAYRIIFLSKALS